MSYRRSVQRSVDGLEHARRCSRRTWPHTAVSHGAVCGRAPQALQSLPSVLSTVKKLSFLPSWTAYFHVSVNRKAENRKAVHVVHLLVRCAERRAPPRCNYYCHIDTDYCYRASSENTAARIASGRQWLLVIIKHAPLSDLDTQRTKSIGKCASVHLAESRHPSVRCVSTACKRCLCWRPARLNQRGVPQ